ncbi:TetR/AcrR family transcriptional regulator [Leifsonia sp. NPDC058292]|uniref:TetR/AcrR family transcriptional regulator n=1 Tax=Leifsonia sp. NPDC058292 TaxID=3346428 RepID=UPI0036D78606
MTADGTLLWPTTTTTKRGPKPKMTLDRIVDAAIGLADEHGLATVSMQRVADELGATKMSLYRYLPGKAELTALMLDKRLGAPPSPRETNGNEWRHDLRAWTNGVHRRFAEAPWALELAVGARIIGPNELAWMERGLAALADTPLTWPERLDVLALLSGHARNIVQQQTTTGRPEHEIATLLVGIVEENSADFPHVAAAFAGGSAGGGRDDALDFGIERILDGVDALIATRGAL